VAILAFGSILLGTVFGRFFKVWVLVPACALTFAIVFASSAYYGHGLLSALLEFAVIATCLQIGYAFGLLSCVIRDGWQRLKIAREIPCDSSHPAATRKSNFFKHASPVTGNTGRCASYLVILDLPSLRPHARPWLILSNHRGLFRAVSDVFNVPRSPNVRS
jgi:hypothetical protein